jgi:hypothetical protein
MNPEPGCSTFELDLHWSSREAPGPRLAAHLAGCVRCRAYLAQLDAVEATRPEVTSWPGRVSKRWRRLLGVTATGLALAAGMALVLWRSGEATDGGYVGTKGSPAVQLLVSRGGSASIWDGHAPVHPGDALAIRVACEGLSRVAVAGWAASGWARLKDGECPASPAPLPFTLVVDGEPGDERFAVVLSKGALDDGALASAARDTARTADVWTVRFDLPKERR